MNPTEKATLSPNPNSEPAKNTLPSLVSFLHLRSSAFICGSLFLLVLATFLFFYRLGERDLWSSHEARAAQNAQNMLDDGSWGLPRLHDRRPELQKPPLFYWLV